MENCRRIGTFVTIVIMTILIVIPLSNAQDPISMVLETNKDKYVFGETVTAEVVINGVDPIGNVTFEVDDNKDEAVLILTVPIESNGTASVSFVLNKEEFPKGRYMVYAVASLKDTTLAESKMISVLKDTGKKKGWPFRPIFLISGITVITAGTVATVAIIAGPEGAKYGFCKMFVVPLYSRLKRDDVRKQETRFKILGFLTAQPGAHYTEIKRKLNLKNGTATYHLSKLEQEGYIKSQKQGKFKAFYLTSSKKKVIKKHIVKKRKAILTYIEENPGTTQKKIGKDLNLSQQTISHNILNLIREDWIRAERKKGLTRYYAIDKPQKTITEEEELNNDDRLQLLEDRFLRGDISEKTYMDLKKKFKK